MIVVALVAVWAPIYRVCRRDELGHVMSCKDETWSPNNAQIPCQHLPVSFVQ
jgi:hypothetical protein